MPNIEIKARMVAAEQMGDSVHGNYRISSDPSLMDRDFIHSELSKSYWAEGIPKALVEKSMNHSLCFGAFDLQSVKQVGFARVVSDYSTFAYLGDVFVVPEHRGRGVSKFLMEKIMRHPDLQGLRRFCLGTRDAHKLYEKYGFKQVALPENWMEIKVAGIYLNGKKD